MPSEQAPAQVPAQARELTAGPASAVPAWATARPAGRAGAGVARRGCPGGPPATRGRDRGSAQGRRRGRAPTPGAGAPGAGAPGMEPGGGAPGARPRGPRGAGRGPPSIAALSTGRALMTGRMYNRAVWPRLRASFPSVPGTVMTRLSPSTMTSEPDTPRPLTRAPMICCACDSASRLGREPSGVRAVSVTRVPPCRSMPSFGSARLLPVRNTNR